MISYLTNNLDQKIFFKCVFCIVILAQSSTGFGLLVIAGSLYLITSLSKLKSFYLILFAALVCYMIIQSDTRLGLSKASIA